MRRIKEIIVHCSATREGKAFTSEDIDRWHRERGWNGCGYHYVITLNGEIQHGRGEDVVGAHCSGHNKESIGICYIGGCDLVGKAKDTRTEAQKKSMHSLILWLLEKHNLTINDVHCHNEYAAKACPSFSVEQLRKELVEA